jgi:5-formyltetrahydrofolate cyclo-ligase
MRRGIRGARAVRDAAALATAADMLAAHAPLLPGATVAGFVGVRGEPPTLALLAALRARGVRVLLPVLLDDMDLEWAAFDGELADGRLGMSEPTGARLGRDAIADADLVLCPALAVDREGRRLGQGGGSYDRALPRARCPILAVVFDDEVLATVPSEAHDRPVDGVLTPLAGLRWLGEGRNAGE